MSRQLTGHPFGWDPCDSAETAERAADAGCEFVMSNNFAFGGINTFLIFNAFNDGFLIYTDG
jgi:3-oxoacyl-(acyl-carrier-protein) synthase